MKIKTISIVVSIVVLSAMTNLTLAAGTAAGTNIDNTASIAYKVGGVDQTEIESSESGNSNPGEGNGSATTFVVDKKIDLLVTAGSGTNVVPGAVAGAATSLEFTLKNEGNSTEEFDLTPSQVEDNDEFNTSDCTVTSPSLPVSLDADASTTVTVQCTVPDSSDVVTNGATSIIDLLATTQNVTETTDADSAGTVDVVFADDTGTTTDGANRNAKHSATNTYTINTADLSVSKISAVNEDPFNGTTNPKRIPGATIEYTITVTNAANAQEATDLVISDLLQSDLTFVSCSTSSDVASVTCSESGGTVSTSAFTLPADTTETLTIIATVN